jgi:hypothetical protein
MSDVVDRYRQAVGEAETVVQSGLRMAAQGRPASGREAEIVAVVFPKLLLHARAILDLAPRPVLPWPAGETWDISSMAALARALIESYYMMFYVAVDRVPDDIREFRWLLWDYHCASRTLEMLRLARPEGEDGDLADAEAAVSALQTAIGEHPVFLRQTRLVRKSVREGQLSIFSTNTDLSSRAGIDPRYYRAAFMFLSSYVHAHAFSIRQLSAFRSGTEGGLRLVTTVVEYCTAYVCLALRDYAGLLPAHPGPEGDAAAVVRRWTAIVSGFNGNGPPIGNDNNAKLL